MKYFTFRTISSRRRGATVVLVAVMLPVLLGFLALAVDVGHMALVLTETQDAVDAAALAGVSGFIETDGVYVSGRASAFLNRNLDFASDSTVATTVEIGEWHVSTATFTTLSPDDAPKANAVRVTARRENVVNFFASLFGKHHFEIYREAIAMAAMSSQCRLWGIDNVKLAGGSITDSYDSTTGPYDAASARPEGDICSCGDIDLSGGAVVDGDALHGDSYTVEINGIGTHVTGDIEPVPTCIDPVLDFGDVATLNDNGLLGLTDAGFSPWKGPMSLSLLNLKNGDNLTIPGGTYYFASIQLLGGSTLTVTGPTTMYVAGDLKVLGGGAINTSQDPWNLTIYSAASLALGQKVTWNGSSDFYGTLIAPDTVVSISGNGDFYGLLIGLEVELDSASFHADESLLGPGILPTHAELVR